MTAAKPHNGGFNRETWLTPKYVIEALGQFDLDPCAAPSPRPWPTAKRHIELPEDGLKAEWNGRVWLNPPYGAESERWLAALAIHGNGIALTFARTETKAFDKCVWRMASAILFLEGRITFCNRDGKPAKHNGGAPSCLVAYGAGNAQALSDASQKLRGALVGTWWVSK